MTIRLSRLTVIGTVVRSQISMKSDIMTAKDKESRRGIEELKAEGKTSTGER